MDHSSYNLFNSPVDDDDDDHSKKFRENLEARERAFKEEMRVQDEETRKAINVSAQQRKMLEEENNIRLLSCSSRRLKVAEIFRNNRFVLFVLSSDFEEYQKVAAALIKKKISFATVPVDEDADIRLGIKDDIKKWYNNNYALLNEVANYLKLVKIGKSDRENEQISNFICKSFLTLFTILWEEDKELLQTETHVGQFFLRLKSAYIYSQWSTFYNMYERCFDCVIHFAREQKLIDIQVEGIDGKMFSSFHDAKEDRDRVENAPTLCFSNGSKIDQEVKVANSKEDCSQNAESYKRSSASFLLFCCSDKSRKKRSSKSIVDDSRRKVVAQQPTDKSITSADILKVPRSDGWRSEKVFVPESLHAGSSQTIQSDQSSKTTKDESKPVEEFEKKLKEIVSKGSERQKSSEVHHTVKTNETERPAIHSFTFRRNQLDSSFQRKMNEQNMKFADEITKMKEKRKRLNEEAEEEMRKFSIESAMRIQMLLNCIHLKLRWEEHTEQEWNDWLKCARDPVIKVKNEFLDFDRIRRYDDEDEIRSEVLSLHKYVQMAYDKLVHAFGTLTMLSDQYEDKIFLKVIQRSISNVATKMCYLLDELEEFQNNEQFFARTKELEASIDSMDVPTTSRLRSICREVGEDYKFVTPPKQPKSYCVITEI